MAIRAQAPDHYAVLGVTAQVEANQLKKPYFRLCRIVHPDKCQHPLATRVFQRVQAAFDCLSDPERRAKYNLEQRSSFPSSSRARQPPPADAVGGAGGSSSCVPPRARRLVAARRFAGEVAALRREAALTRAALRAAGEVEDACAAAHLHVVRRAARVAGPLALLVGIAAQVEVAALARQSEHAAIELNTRAPPHSTRTVESGDGRRGRHARRQRGAPGRRRRTRRRAARRSCRAAQTWRRR